NDHLLVVQGNVGPIEGVPVLLDTGKSPTAISPEVAKGLDIHGELQPLLFSNGTIQVESVILPSVSIGNLEVSGVRVLVQDLSYFEKRYCADSGASPNPNPKTPPFVGGFRRELWRFYL